MCRLTWAQAAICHPYSSQPDPYPQSSLAQQARCLIPTKRLPAGGCVVVGSWGDKGREELWELGSSTARPFDLVPGPAGQTAQTDSIVSAPCRLLLSLFYQPHRPQGLTERQREGEEKGDREQGVVGKMNTMKRLTRTTLTLRPPLHSSFGTDLYIPYGQAAALSSSPLCDPSRLFPPLSPQQPQPGEPPALCEAEHAPAGRLYATIFSKCVSNMLFIV